VAHIEALRKEHELSRSDLADIIHFKKQFEEEFHVRFTFATVNNYITCLLFFIVGCSVVIPFFIRLLVGK